MKKKHEKRKENNGWITKMGMSSGLDAGDRLKRAKIQIQRKNPFFAYLSLYLKMKEATEKELPDYAGAGVDVRGNFLFNKKFVEKLTDEEVEGVVIHEILHLSLLHLLRCGGRDHTIFNVSADICANEIIQENGFVLPQGCLMPDSDHKIKLNDKITIKDCNKKTAEDIYDEIEKKVPKKIVEGWGRGQGRFDYHMPNKPGDGNGEGNDKDGKNKNGGGGAGDKFKEGGGQPLNEEEKRELSEFWKQKTQEAYVTAKMRGNVPAGIERLVGALHKEKVGWRAILQKYIQSHLPVDYTYRTPNKKSVSSGFYMPNILKEQIDVMVAVDTSGSIGEAELKDFMSEMKGIGRAFRGVIKMRILTHDCAVHEDYVLENGNLDKADGLKLKGGGGTSHKVVFDYIDENVIARGGANKLKVLICFTDGESDLEEVKFGDYHYDKLMVISENGTDSQVKESDGKNGVKIIKLKDFKYG